MRRWALRGTVTNSNARFAQRGRGALAPPTPMASQRQASTSLAAVNPNNSAPIQLYRGPLSKASKVASSSKVKLDNWLGVDPHVDRGADWSFKLQPDRQHEHDEEPAAPAFASEEELVAALTESTLALSPVAAYRALRSLSLFSHYLQTLGPRIKTVYAALRADGVTHNLLVSDLLLRYPDAAILREVLVEEAAHVHSAPIADCLREGLVAQAYRIVAPAARQRTVPHLPAGTLAMVSHALQAHGHSDLVLLEDVFYEMAHSSSFSGDDAWPCLEIVLHLSKHGRPERGLRLLQYPIALGKLPAAMGRTSSAHAEPATLMAQSAVVRCALYWGLDGRAQRSVTDLVTTMSRTAISPPALELVYTTIRAACVRRRPTDINWAGRTMRAITNDSAFPPLPSATTELYYTAASTRDALAFYEATPAERAASPGPNTVLRLALASPRRDTLARLADELAFNNDLAPAIPGILRALTSARLLSQAERIYAEWRKRNVLDADTTIAMVRAFTRGGRSKHNTSLARTVVEDYLDKAPASAEVKAVVEVHATALIGQGNSEGKATATAAERLIAALGYEGAMLALDDLVQRSPLLAHRFAALARTSGLPPAMPGVAIAASCAAGNWGSLAVARSTVLSPAESAAVRSLTKARARRITAAVAQFAAACDDYPTDPVLVPTAVALLRRCTILSRWEAGFNVLIAAIPEGAVQPAASQPANTIGATQSPVWHGEEEVAEAVCGFLSRLAQGGDTGRTAYLAYQPLVVSRLKSLRGPSREILSAALHQAEEGLRLHTTSVTCEGDESVSFDEEGH